jgi:hypothetical protein
MKAYHKILCPTLLFLLFIPIGNRAVCADPPLLKNMEQIIVETDGYGYFSMNKTGEQLKQEAIADAKRKALESAWTKIQSYSKMKNFELVVDIVQSEASGFVRVLNMKDSGLEGNRYHVWIKAEVNYSLQPASTVKKEKEKLSADVGVFFEGDDGKPYPIRNGMVLYSNDNYAIYFKPGRKCYMYVFQEDSTGKVYRLFPNIAYGTETNPVSKGKEYWVPTRDTWLYLDENVGRERLYIIASMERSQKLASLANAAKNTPAVSKEAFSDTIKTMGPAGIRASRVSKVSLPNKSVIEVLSEKTFSEKSEFIHSVWFWHK